MSEKVKARLHIEMKGYVEVEIPKAVFDQLEGDIPINQIELPAEVDIDWDQWLDLADGEVDEIESLGESDNEDSETDGDGDA
jgi:hypothetical protein